MRLKRVALKYVKEKMEAWDTATESWIPNAFLGRLDLTDRFIGNFNRTTRMRMMFTANETLLPESLTIRHPGTKDVYILGTKRTDALAGNPYISLTLARLATDLPGGTAGYATITRKVVQGPANDPGWLVDTLVARSWIDTEFLSSTDETETTDLRIERYNAYLPLNIQPREWDFISLHGVKYRVLDTFADSGFFAMRIDHEADYRSDFVLHVQPPKVMDKTTHQYVQEPAAAYNVTGMMERNNDSALWTSDSEKYIDVYFERDHVPFDLTITGKEMWLELNGVKRMVKSVDTQSGKRQFLLRVL